MLSIMTAMLAESQIMAPVPRETRHSCDFSFKVWIKAKHGEKKV